MPIEKQTRDTKKSKKKKLSPVKTVQENSPPKLPIDPDPNEINDCLPETEPPEEKKAPVKQALDIGSMKIEVPDVYIEYYKKYGFTEEEIRSMFEGKPCLNPPKNYPGTIAPLSDKPKYRC